MCGIAGYISNTPLSQTQLTEFTEKVSDSIYHRGPDGLGVWNNEHVFFLHRRLKIIDLDDRANQPFHSDDKRYSIIFNGEIYNYLELKEEHLNGQNFRTKSDTEVLIKLYEKYGDNCVKYLNGIFAFAIIDHINTTVSIFRDHYGVKPVYYYYDQSKFVFASEIKALFAFGINAQLDKETLGEQIVYGYVAGVHTIYQNIKRLLPGHQARITWDKEVKLTISEYFDLTKNVFPKGTKISEEQVLVGLKLAIKRQVVSDVPVGFMCSGGIDSSAIAALAAKIYQGRVNTYCAKITQEDYDESVYSQIVADHIHSHHAIIPSDPKDTARLLPALIWAHDEPMRHPNSIPIYQVNKRAKQDVTVLLTGEGSDEIFAGYWVFPLVRYLNIFRILVPGFIKKILLFIMLKMGRQAKTMQAMMSKSVPELFVNISSSYDASNLGNLLKDTPINLDERRRIASKSYVNSGNNIFQGFQYFYQQIHLVSSFDRQDKMSMINAIEGRVPFMDIELVKIANSLPYSKKIKGATTKVILRKITSTFLPESIYNRPKYAFSLPVYNWAIKSVEFRRQLENVSGGYLVKQGIIDADTYGKLLKNFLAGNQGLGDIIWNILNLELAANIFVEKSLKLDMSDFIVHSKK